MKTDVDCVNVGEVGGNSCQALAWLWKRMRMPPRVPEVTGTHQQVGTCSMADHSVSAQVTEPQCAVAAAGARPQRVRHGEGFPRTAGVGQALPPGSEAWKDA